jgi:hypothetical protein
MEHKYIWNKYNNFKVKTSHHPPISHFLIYGPNESYKIHGCYKLKANAGLNSLTVTPLEASRTITFADGQ